MKVDKGTPARRPRARVPAIRQALLDHVDAHPADLVSFVAKKFGVSRQAVHRRAKELVASGELLVEGQLRHARYRRATIVRQSVRAVTPALEEDRVWQEFAPIFRDVKPNVTAICAHGFTEMVNNVIDHSEASHVTIFLEKDAQRVAFRIHDNGVGIFNKIQRECHLENPEEAILELSKGKLTTDPSKHSGEGIFFTSRMFDRFSILSGGLFFGHKRGGRQDWLLSEFKKEGTGTSVFMAIGLDSPSTPKEVFDQYSTTHDGMGFDRTVVSLDLAGSGSLISRSQAKRVVSRLDRFKEAVLDFNGVESIGQAFADEIFRVYALSHPQVEITAIHANEAVQTMITRAQNTARQSEHLETLRAALQYVFANENPTDDEKRWQLVRNVIAHHDPAEGAILDALEAKARPAMLKLIAETIGLEAGDQSRSATSNPLADEGTKTDT